MWYKNRKRLVAFALPVVVCGVVCHNACHPPNTSGKHKERANLLVSSFVCVLSPLFHMCVSMCVCVCACVYVCVCVGVVGERRMCVYI